ncbi:dynein 1 light intermediate chain [Armillaria gallica]|uniref:Dynein 1 light intermediate chain n=1 Tax=Armillaria gallica TaxID=47427 RepID=A0A2H3E9R5_ARMGA|nr:dynein 1 light intermediate chain [Armillaria gallica]
MDSRPTSPEAPPQDLWSSILDSVSSSRSINSKQILLLGQPSAGKSTLASALLQKPLDNDGKEDHKVDFALGYDFAAVRDDADEDTLARLSVYTVPSSNPSYTALLPHFLPPRTCLPHTLVMIVLDWTRPWTFVEELEIWFKWIDDWVNNDSSREAQIAREEGRERLQSHLQHYTEPSSDPIPATSTLSSSTLLPLGSGTFTHNTAGIPIIVTCTKADLIDEGHDLVAGASGMGGMVKGTGGEWEERTDGIMQVLRTICLKYGAALFYTTPLPTTLQVLRHYALHLLFAPPAPSPAVAAGGEPPATVRNPFPFKHKPNPLDRDHLVIPAGWDSWGKIEVVRPFEPRTWGEAWERDLEAGYDPASDEMGAKRMFQALVPDQGTKPPPLPPFNSPVPEQTFLLKNYEENLKKADRDPRGAFRNPAELEGAAAGVVGPLGSSSFNLPNVVKALSEMEMGSNSGSGPSSSSIPDAATARRLTGRTATGRPTTLGTQTSPRQPSSPPLGTSPSPTAAGGQTQHEVLQNFFQSLLSNRDRPSPTSASRPAANGTSSTAPGGQDDASS